MISFNHTLHRIESTKVLKTKASDLQSEPQLVNLQGSNQMALSIAQLIGPLIGPHRVN